MTIVLILKCPSVILNGFIVVVISSGDNSDMGYAQFLIVNNVIYHENLVK
jgi:hypothetical protein